MKRSPIVMLLGAGTLVFGLAACGDELKKPILELEVPELPDTSVEPDEGEEVVDDADTGGEDVPPELPGDTGPDAPDAEVVTNTCTVNADCDDLPVTGCQNAVCDDGACVAEAIPLCCEQVADCAGQVEPPSECHAAACNAGKCEVVAVPDCCLTDEDCGDAPTNCCETATCNTNTNQCVLADVPGCCESSADCSDGNAATTDLCLSTCVAGGCAFKPPVCTTNKTYTQKTFDDGTFQAMVPTQPVSGASVWHPTQTARVSLPYGVHFGHPTCLTYYNGPLTTDCERANPLLDGTAFDSKLSLTPVTLDANAGVFLSFWVRMSAEPAFPGAPEINLPPQHLDYLKVTVNDGSGPKMVWRSTDAFGFENTTHGEFVHQTVNLASYAGKTVTIAFTFYADAPGNYGPAGGAPWEGAFIDNIRVRVTCEAAFCDTAGAACPDDGSGCTTDTCTLYANGGGGVCSYPVATPGETCTSCAQAADCGTDGCFDYACTNQQCNVSLKESCCAPSATFPSITQAPAVDTEGFEGGALVDWSIEDPYLDDDVSWQVDEGGAFQGAASLYFGDPATQTFEAIGESGPQPSVATVWTPAFPVNPETFRTTVAQFWLFMGTEYDGAGAPAAGEAFDTLTVLVRPVGSKTTTEVWTSQSTIGNSTDGGWVQVGIDLSQFEGQSVRLGFEFDSGSEVANAGHGVRIDDLQVVAVCGADPCLGQSDCGDGDACTADVCELGECTSVKEDPLCCTTTADCNDGNTCTIDACDTVASTCTFTYNEATIATCCSEGAWSGGWSTSFEDGKHGFTVKLDTAPVTWHVTDAAASAGQNSLNFSNPATDVFAHPDGKAVKGQAVSPAILVPPYGKGKSFAEFKLLLETFWDSTDEPFTSGPFVIDELRVKVMENGVIKPDPIWVSHFLENTTRGAWVTTRADLTPYKGKTIQLVFEFDSGDASDNDFGGPFIDQVAFKTTCVADSNIKCINGNDCTPLDACHTVSCSETFTCVQTPKATPECCKPTWIADKALTFEGTPSSAWKLDTCTPGGGPGDATSKWQFATSTQAAAMGTKQGTQVLYFGNGTDYGGSLEKASCGTAVTPPITLDPEVPWNMRFWVYLDIEKDASCGGTAAPFADNFEVAIIDTATGAAGSAVFTKAKLGCNQYKTWQQVSVDLSAYAGKTVQLRFSFSSWDELDNAGKGIGIDHVEFERGCSETF